MAGIENRDRDTYLLDAITLLALAFLLWVMRCG